MWTSANLTYTATLANGSPLPAWLGFNASTRTFSGTPPQDINGSVDLKVTASDGSLSVSDTFTLTIDPVNDAPVVRTPIADQTTPEDTAWTFQVPADAFADVDSSLTYKATLASGGSSAELALVRCSDAHLLRHTACGFQRLDRPQDHGQRRFAQHVRHASH